MHPAPEVPLPPTVAPHLEHRSDEPHLEHTVAAHLEHTVAAHLEHRSDELPDPASQLQRELCRQRGHVLAGQTLQHREQGSLAKERAQRPAQQPVLCRPCYRALLTTGTKCTPLLASASWPCRQSWLCRACCLFLTGLVARDMSPTATLCMLHAAPHKKGGLCSRCTAAAQ